MLEEAEEVTQVACESLNETITKVEETLKANENEDLQECLVQLKKLRKGLLFGIWN